MKPTTPEPPTYVQAAAALRLLIKYVDEGRDECGTVRKFMREWNSGGSTDSIEMGPGLGIKTSLQLLLLHRYISENPATVRPITFGGQAKALRSLLGL